MQKSHLTLVDAHVHIHRNFKIENFIDAAFFNFRKNANKISSDYNFDGVLCLTESQDVNYFESIKSNIKSLSKYKLTWTQEANSFFCSDTNNTNVFFISGKQIVTKERLEVLALGFNENYKDGRPIDEVVDFVILKNALPVIPWGVGKWNGKRGTVVNNLINYNSKILFLGDNGNRPLFWKKPGIFYKAEKKGIIDLPGSDPLPFNSEENRPGSFGFFFYEKLSEQTPFKDLKEKIINCKDSLPTYGKLESPLRFFRNQISIQIKKNIKNK